ncbi:hypothetical protein L596_002902 [Steinernema carpocapsae]|uniref:Chondroitin proteoglycan 4 domain-containing protein n=1 Tax=Steinernema carpocapsae TaxID=34508 RepID=A0A4U8UR10_STECR|nr:hypothetical protein L596_002902 [Steinernema carpocapsae]
MTVQICLAAVLIGTVLCNDLPPVDKAAQEGFSALFNANIPGITVRQCSCEEERKCVEEIKAQVFDCADQCWYKFAEITTRPGELKLCADQKKGLFNDFVDCFETNVNSCVDSPNGPQIAKKDILKMFRIGEEKFAVQKESIMRNSMVKPIRKVVDTALEFGFCVKECFLAKNQNGFCFDNVGCQPLLTEKKSTSALKKCMKRMDWKKEAGDLCDCSVRAGVESLERYCPMLRLMSSKRRSKATTTSKP